MINIVASNSQEEHCSVAPAELALSSTMTGEAAPLAACAPEQRPHHRANPSPPSSDSIPAGYISVDY